MTTENEALVSRLWHEIWIDGDLDKLGEIVADPYVRHTRDGTMSGTPADYARHIESAIRTIRGTELTISTLASVDDMVFARLRLHAMNLSTGTPLKLTWLAQYRIEGDRIAEAWSLHQSGIDW